MTQWISFLEIKVLGLIQMHRKSSLWPDPFKNENGHEPVEAAVIINRFFSFKQQLPKLGSTLPIFKKYYNVFFFLLLWDTGQSHLCRHLKIIQVTCDFNRVKRAPWCQWNCTFLACVWYLSHHQECTSSSGLKLTQNGYSLSNSSLHLHSPSSCTKVGALFPVVRKSVDSICGKMQFLQTAQIQ